LAAAQNDAGKAIRAKFAKVLEAMGNGTWNWENPPMSL